MSILGRIIKCDKERERRVDGNEKGRCVYREVIGVDKVVKG